MIELEERKDVESDIYQLKLATYGADPEGYRKLIFPEWCEEEEEISSLDELLNHDGPITYVSDDTEIMTPAKMREILQQVGQ